MLFWMGLTASCWVERQQKETTLSKQCAHSIWYVRPLLTLESKRETPLIVCICMLYMFFLHVVLFWCNRVRIQIKLTYIGSWWMIWGYESQNGFAVFAPNIAACFQASFCLQSFLLSVVHPVLHSRRLLSHPDSPKGAWCACWVLVNVEHSASWQFSGLHLY